MIIYINLIFKENFLNKSKFKKILACFLTVFFTFFYNVVLAGNSVHVFADVPKNLEECCLELKKICTQEEEFKIKSYNEWHSLDYGESSSYKNPLDDIKCGRLGRIIMQDWLYLPPEQGQTVRTRRSELANLLLAHGAGLEGESDHTMFCIILEYYNHYLKNGISMVKIEDLVIDHWFNFWRKFRKDVTREQFKARMDIWLNAKKSSKHQTSCNIL